MLPMIRSIVFKLAALVIAVAFMFVFYQLCKLRVVEEKLRHAPPSKDMAVMRQVTTIPSTTMIQKTVYTRCGDEEESTFLIADSQVGITQEQFQTQYPNSTINKFHDHEVTLTTKIDSFCNVHASTLFVGIKEGNVTVYYGNPSAKPVVKEVTNIKIADLSAADMSELRKGIIIRFPDELAATLERLQQSGKLITPK